jgi:hypothetical protein
VKPVILLKPEIAELQGTEYQNRREH